MSSLAARVRTVALAAVAACVLAACNQTDDIARKANMPLSPQMLSLIAQKDMVPASPILVRIFKQESELEVWKVTNDGTYALLKTYPICRWSGELGPKVRMGDRQAPEGFYTITPGQMNPNSNYYLSFNLGFPNSFDKAYGRTGEFLMVHGDCSSAGCYAMTDEQISEIFSLARESFAGGQRSFQVQAYPFRMTPTNMARHRSNPNMPFWRNLKEGYDHFAVTRQEPKVNVCNRHYVFDATAAPGASFSADAACPPYEVPAAIAQAVDAKEKADNAKIAALSTTQPLAPVRTNSDGGMHPVFLAKLKERESGELSFAQAPGSLPEYVNPPRMTPEKKLLDSQTEETVGLSAVANASEEHVPVAVAPVAAAPAPEAPATTGSVPAVAEAAPVPAARPAPAAPAPKPPAAVASAPKLPEKPQAAQAAPKPPTTASASPAPQQRTASSVSAFADPPSGPSSAAILSASGFTR